MNGGSPSWPKSESALAPPHLVAYATKSFRDFGCRQEGAIIVHDSSVLVICWGVLMFFF